MAQLRGRFTDDQVKVLVNAHCQGLLKSAQVQEMLHIGKTRFFALVKAYRNAPEAFSVGYERRTPGRLAATVEMEIERELVREKATVEDKRLPLSRYNHSGLRDRLREKNIEVSANPIIGRAKRLEYYETCRSGRPTTAKS